MANISKDRTARLAAAKQSQARRYTRPFHIRKRSATAQGAITRSGEAPYSGGFFSAAFSIFAENLKNGGKVNVKLKAIVHCFMPFLNRDINLVIVRFIFVSLCCDREKTCI